MVRTQKKKIQNHCSTIDITSPQTISFTLVICCEHTNIYNTIDSQFLNFTSNQTWVISEFCLIKDCFLFSNILKPQNYNTYKI